MPNQMSRNFEPIKKGSSGTADTCFFDVGRVLYRIAEVFSAKTIQLWHVLLWRRSYLCYWSVWGSYHICLRLVFLPNLGSLTGAWTGNGSVLFLSTRPYLMSLTVLASSFTCTDLWSVFYLNTGNLLLLWLTQRRLINTTCLNKFN